MLQIEEEDIVIGGLKVKVKFKWKLGSFITYMVKFNNLYKLFKKKSKLTN